jgi:protease-4
MDADRKGWFSRALRVTWQVITWARNVVFSLLTIFFLVLVVVALFSLGGPKVPSSTILVLRMEGELVEQLSADPVGLATRQALGQRPKQTLVWDVVDALRAAKDDQRVKAVFLDLNPMNDMSLVSSVRVAALDEVKRAIQEFRKSGKKVIAAADSYSATTYSLAAQADEIYLHTLGFVLLEGLGRFRDYYKDGLDRFEVEVNVIRVGEYKSAVEPYLRNNMSPEDKQAAIEWMGDLWRSTLAQIADTRKLKPEDLAAYVDRPAASLQKAAGDGAKLAFEAHLVDRVGTREDVRARLIDLAGEDKKTHSFQKVDLHDYLKVVGKDRTEPPGGDKVVAVVVAKGEIMDGEQPPGTIGGDSTAALLRKARTDEKIKAIVLRVDSPGGSANGSEMIREECANARRAGKPVVVSMGAVAASGGYWISTASDEIWASADTITGSIGIFGMLPTVEKPLAKYLGVHADGVGTTPLAAAYRPDRSLDGEVRTLLEQVIYRGYREFLERVSQARKKTPEDVDKIARGRVWSGRRAQEIGLVDKLGGLAEAIASAAEHAKLGKNYKVQFVEKERKFSEKLIAELMGSALWKDHFASLESGPHVPIGILEKMANPLSLWERVRVRGMEIPAGKPYAYCGECDDN